MFLQALDMLSALNLPLPELWEEVSEHFEDCHRHLFGLSSIILRFFRLCTLSEQPTPNDHIDYLTITQHRTKGTVTSTVFNVQILAHSNNSIST